MNNKLKKAANLIKRKMIIPLYYVSSDLYTKHMTKYLKKNGMNIKGTPFYFSTSIYFDGTDYSLITLEDGISISSDVAFLTHDFSANTVYKGLELSNIEELEQNYKINRLRRLQTIRVGAHTFIGAKSFILPGSDIGRNVIVGAGSVVRGKIPDNSIVIGNPARVIKKTSEWLEKQKFGE